MAATSQNEEKFYDYDGFVEKFKPKKTTDDCYTPSNVYDAVLEWTANEYGIDPTKVVRPFYPGGDYQSFDYPDGSVVADNPPFSILTQIVKWYNAQKIPFVLFAPALTLPVEHAAGIVINVSIVYDNGATVATSFVTNLEDCLMRTAPALRQAVDTANKENLAQKKKSAPKYVYPSEVISPALMSRCASVDLRIDRTEACRINALDAQRAVGKSIFGSGYLLSEKAAAEKAAAKKAFVWTLSDREREIVKNLGGA